MPLGHEKLVAWQRADDLFVAIHRLATAFPPEERYELASQIRRAAYSVPANIVEGMARRSLRERLRFLNIAEASLAEVSYCLHVSQRLGYVTPEAHDSFDRAVRQVGAPLTGLMRSMKKLPDWE
ncbi:MAG TPA: four helix bundle protein [Vicinamibacterales bacterium]|nr:four helix bundle protein [Vicinamibacterales bacterium]